MDVNDVHIGRWYLPNIDYTIIGSRQRSGENQHCRIDSASCDCRVSYSWSNLGVNIHRVAPVWRDSHLRHQHSVWCRSRSSRLYPATAVIMSKLRETNWWLTTRKFVSWYHIAAWTAGVLLCGLNYTCSRSGDCYFTQQDRWTRQPR